MSGHKDYIHCVAVLEKSNQCISGSEDGTVRLWGGFLSVRFFREGYYLLD